jgi:hypothetical protein
MAQAAHSRKRWDTDDRFVGAAEARGFARGVEVVTGIPDGGPFASHGHSLRLTLSAAL